MASRKKASNKSLPQSLHIGCCGFREARERYMKKFAVVEVQHTFYDPPSKTTLEKWRNEAPRDFEFSLKAWQLITHTSESPTYRRMKTDLTEIEAEGCGAFRPTRIVEEAFERTIECAQILQAHLILFQCPARFAPTEENVENFRSFFTRHRPPEGCRFLWEPRGKWPPALIHELCTELALTHVVDPFLSESVTRDFYYYRIHGKRGRDFVFKEDEVEDLARSLDVNETTYVFFNNVRMLEDAKRLQQAFGKVAALPLVRRPRTERTLKSASS